MGSNSIASLCYGVICDPYLEEEDEGYFEIPWSEEDIEDWWLKVNGFAYNDSLGWEANYEKEKAFLLENPIPFSYGHSGYDGELVTILCLPSPYYKVSWGSIYIEGSMTLEEEPSEFLNFLATYLPGAPSPKWVLSSLYL